MTRPLTIWLFLFVLVSTWAVADNYIDDVYFWDDGSVTTTQAAVDTTSNRVAVSQQSGLTDEAAPTSNVIFLEESNDTIVKAVIRR
ncbi:MAG: hypothetical protein J5612_03415 [Paludibacteraceae bacterium]|nr:hypothetical protein [Paludibacteraceae bacterium]